MPKIQGSQRDFSAGELDVAMKRADENPIMKAGARQCANLRILNSKAVQNRPGRTALFLTPASPRVEEITIAAGVVYRFAFIATGRLIIYNSAGAIVFDLSGYSWTTAALVNTLVYAVFQKSVYVCCQSSTNPPQVFTYDGVTPWTTAQYAVLQTASQQVRTPFYRLSPLNVLMQPSATTGAITLTFTGDIMTVAAVGTVMRFCGREMVITGFTNAHTLSASVIEVLPPGQQVPVDSNANFAIGDVVIGQKSGAKAIVTGVVVGQIIVQLLNTVTTTTAAATGASEFPGPQQLNTAATSVGFINPEVVAGPGGSANVNGAVVSGAPNPVAVWDDSVINGNRGWPRSVFVDQNRLGFCDIPALPNAIVWSAIGSPTDLYIDAQPASAIMELAPDKVRVQHVVPGMEGSEFVFTDGGIHYIPITATNPLKPGSVAFNVLSQEGCAAVQPRRAGQSIIYVKAGGKLIGAVQSPGAYYRPYVVDGISEMHAHLFNNPIAIAIPGGSTQFEETYIYILNADSTIAVGKYLMKSGLLDAGPDGKPHVGWVPWSGAGVVNWISALGANVMFSTSYTPNGIAPVAMVEVLDDTAYLDGAVFLNAEPTALLPVPGHGPLWFLPGGAVTLMDQGTRMMGTYQVDGNGFIVPQGNAGENLAAATLVAGQPWTATLEPFVPDAPPGGQDVHQRMQPRRVSRMATYVSNSTGFLQARLFSGKQTSTSPALGTVMNNRRVTAWNQDDDPTKPPPLREEAQRWRPIGRSFDPRVAIIKDTPGPIVIHEIAMEATG